ncbi:MAG: hypothetical protein HKL98_03790 [Burkholderiales bacterium]|nr:hypothetical protein [Burkholderiales bacterium]
MQSPNELEGKRIERALLRRVRYRYVTPIVCIEEDGYRIESPCCSRNIDPSGGPVDIALLKFGNPHWLLHFKDHANQSWVLHSVTGSLSEALEILLPDEERVFWP